MSKKYNVLVTGCGGDIGQSIAKILKSNQMFGAVAGCDMHNEHAGKFIFDNTYILPGCRADDYFDKLKGIAEQEKADIIIPMAEAELRLFSDKGISKALFGKPLVMANPRCLAVGFDKLATANFLKENGLPFPVTNIVKEIDSPDLPVVIKSRDGSGSKSLFVIRTSEDYAFYAKKFPDFIAQEMVGNDRVEYTCGLFKADGAGTRTIIYRRRLMGGFSGYGVYEENPVIEELLCRIANLLDLNGSINVQLRLSEKGPCVFEINPRFSSTVMFRHMMGFEDVIWSIQAALGLPVSEYLRKTQFNTFYKGFNEYVD